MLLSNFLTIEDKNKRKEYHEDYLLKIYKIKTFRIFLQHEM